MRRLLLAFCAAAIGLSGCSSDADIRTPRARADFQRMVEYVRSEGAPGVVLLVRNRSGTWRASGGRSVVEPPSPIRVGDRFRIASVSKTFVAALVLKLVADGRITLDGLIDEQLPGIIPPSRRITVRQLLNHTSGLYDYVADRRLRERWFRDVRFVMPPRAQISLGVSRPPVFEAGRDWGYSNTGYEVLGVLVEHVTHDSLGRALARSIFTPLGFENSSLESEPGVPDSTAHGYALPGGDVPVPGNQPLDVTEGVDGGAWADGGIVSTPEEVAAFYGALLGGKVMGPEALRGMLRTVPGDFGDSGLGIFRRRVTCGYAWGHGGSMSGYRTEVLASRDGSHVVVAVANGNNDAVSSAITAVAVNAYCTS
jgi:D-alanyl-D-alanine carboxypeptidase